MGNENAGSFLQLGRRRCVGGTSNCVGGGRRPHSWCSSTGRCVKDLNRVRNLSNRASSSQAEGDGSKKSSSWLQQLDIRDCLMWPSSPFGAGAARGGRGGDRNIDAINAALDDLERSRPSPSPTSMRQKKASRTGPSTQSPVHRVHGGIGLGLLGPGFTSHARSKAAQDLMPQEMSEGAVAIIRELTATPANETQNAALFFVGCVTADEHGIVASILGKSAENKVTLYLQGGEVPDPECKSTLFAAVPANEGMDVAGWTGLFSWAQSQRQALEGFCDIQVRPTNAVKTHLRNQASDIEGDDRTQWANWSPYTMPEENYSAPQRALKSFLEHYDRQTGMALPHDPYEVAAPIVMVMERIDRATTR